MKDKSGFQLIIMGVFGFFILVAVIIFATGGRGDGTGSGQVAVMSLWGSASENQMNTLVDQINRELGDVLEVKYTFVPEEQFDDLLIEALASNRGPDAILLSNESIVRHSDKIYRIPYESLSQRDYKDRFIELGDLFLTPSGIMALPFSVDPLVMYWNRSLLSSAGVSAPPAYWVEMLGVARRVTDSDDSRNIHKSAIALGEFVNIEHAKEILLALIMQAGNPVTEYVGAEVDVVITDLRGGVELPAVSATRFFTEFSNPIKPSYSWNRALPQSDDMFLAGDLAIYLGFAHELFELRQRNPNLNFDVALLPQVKDSDFRSTYGQMHGVAILNSSRNKGSAVQAAGILSGTVAGANWDAIAGLPPVRRELLSLRQTDEFRSIFYLSSLISRGFLDLDRGKTGAIFSRMIGDVTSGRLSEDAAISKAQKELDRLLK